MFINSMQPLSPLKIRSVPEFRPPSYDEAAKGCSYEPPLKRQATFGEEPIEKGARQWSRLARGATDDEVVVTVWKRCEDAGLTLRSDIGGRAYVHAAVGEAAGVIGPFDELVEVGGKRLLTAKPAILANALLRSAPLGRLTIRMRPCPEAAVRAARLLQDRLRTIHARSQCVERRVIHKPTPDKIIGLSLSADFQRHSVVNGVKRGSLAARALGDGDLITHINGVRCIAPADAARMLRIACGLIEIRVRRGVDLVPLREAERDAEEHGADDVADDSHEGAEELPTLAAPPHPSTSQWPDVLGLTLEQIGMIVATTLDRMTTPTEPGAPPLPAPPCDELIVAAQAALAQMGIQGELAWRKAEIAKAYRELTAANAPNPPEVACLGANERVHNILCASAPSAARP